MTDDDRISISRRKALAGIGTVGAAAGLGGIGTYAQFTDTEEEAVTFSAGGIDGEIVMGASYNGNDVRRLNSDGDDYSVELGELENVEQGDAAGTGVSIHFTDIKPGDYGCFSFMLRVENNPAWVGSCLGASNSSDGRVFEPELEADSDLNASDFDPGEEVSTGGEIDENMLVIPFYKPPVSDGTQSRFNPCIFFDEDNDVYDPGAYKGSGAVGTPSAFWSNSQQGGGSDSPLSPKTLSTALGTGAKSTTTWETLDGAVENVESDNLEGVDVAVDEGCVFLNGDEDTQIDNTQPASAVTPGVWYGFGWDWHVPFDTGNEMMGDEITLNIGFTFSQVRHTENAVLQNIYNPGQNTPN